MNKKVKKLIAKVVLGATMALTVTGAGLISSNVQASASTTTDLTSSNVQVSASTGVYDPKYIEDHNQIQVQSWYYNNCYNYKFKYAREDTGFIKLSYSWWYNASTEEVNLAQQFPNVIYNGAQSQSYADLTLIRDCDGFLILRVSDVPYLNSVNAKFYADDGNNYFYRNTDASPSLYEGNGFTVNRQ